MKKHAIALLALLSVAAASADKSRPVRAVGGPAQWFGPAAYPPEALRAGEEGRVAVRVTVDPAGRPTACEVATSSGSAALDSGTCAIAMAQMQFTPALDRDGHTITGQYPLAVRWVMPHPVESAAASPAEAPPGGPNAQCVFPVGDLDAKAKERACRAVLEALGGKLPVVRGADQSGTPR